MRLRDGAKGADQIAVRHATRPRRLACEAYKATIDMRLCACPRQIAFQHLFHEDDASPWSIHFLAQFGIRWTGRQTEAAMDAGLHRVRHRFAERTQFLWLYRVLH